MFAFMRHESSGKRGNELARGPTPCASHTLQYATMETLRDTGAYEEGYVCDACNQTFTRGAFLCVRQLGRVPRV